ncbi:hypothetical protein K450DRAFT_201383 [Umbelopsis ramanniana AG]|uniref:Uncharacterized protein n=1 Tax=Umbelopsis ramanniana AG TaxID=1314678 RepID=A0AAD5HC37_UMBRA|nr:uncharacterized protein K450DRAFT_201383 [Umbelopsis ramanniana AG]KAI8577156.1 hypothetical protein K450DRAFT_201383 [Umbelopsis ramanniana AG]
MSVLASIAVVTKHSWKAYITFDDYEHQDFIGTHVQSNIPVSTLKFLALTKELFDIRINAIHDLVKHKYPSMFIENLVLLFAIASILLITTISLLLHLLGHSTLETTIPFFMIFIPLRYFGGPVEEQLTNTVCALTQKFENDIEILMRETTQEDVTKEIKWEHRHIRLSDTWRSLKIAKPLCELTNVGIIVQALHVDLTTQLEVMGEDLLPSYNESVPQTTIHISDARLPHYDDLVAHEDIDLADLTRPSYLNPPLPNMALPEYMPTAPQTG